MLVDRKRKVAFQTFKIKGEKKYELHLYPWRLKLEGNTHLQPVNIDLKYGGGLATSIGDGERYEVPFSKLPEEVKDDVRVAVAFVESEGTPMKNDKSVYA